MRVGVQGQTVLSLMVARLRIKRSIRVADEGSEGKAFQIKVTWSEDRQRSI